MTTVGRVAVELTAETQSLDAGFKHADQTIAGFSSKWKSATSGLIVPAAFAQDLPNAAKKNAAEFEKFGRFAQNAGNQLGLGLGGGAIQAGRALSEGMTALRGFTAGATAAAGATNVLKGALAFIGGPIGLGVIAVILAMTKGMDALIASQEKEIERLEQIGEAADEATKRLKAFNAARAAGNSELGDLEGQASAARTGGKSGLERAKEMQAMQREAAEFGRLAARAGRDQLEAETERYAVLLRQRDLRKDIEKSLEREAKLKADAKEQEEAVIRLLNIQNNLRIEAFQQAKATAEWMQKNAAIANASTPWWLNQGTIQEITNRRHGNADANPAPSSVSGTGKFFDPAFMEGVQKKLKESATEMAAGMELISAAVLQGAEGLRSAVQVVTGVPLDAMQAFADKLAGGLNKLFGITSNNDKLDGQVNAMIRLGQLQESQMSQQEQREQELARAHSDSERAILQQIHALEDEAKVREEAVEAERRRHEEGQRNKLTEQDLLLELERTRANGNEEALRQIDREERMRNARTDAHRALLAQIFAQEDANEAVRKAAELAKKMAVDLNGLADAFNAERNAARGRSDAVGRDRFDIGSVGDTRERQRAGFPPIPSDGIGRDAAADDTGDSGSAITQVTRSLATASAPHTEMVLGLLAGIKGEVRSLRADVARVSVGRLIDRHMDTSDVREDALSGSIRA